MACIGCIKCAACFRPLHTVYKPSIYLKVPIGYHGYVPEGLSCSFHDSFGGNVIPSLAAYVAVCSTGPCSFYSYPTVQVHTDRNIYHLSYIIYHISYIIHAPDLRTAVFSPWSVPKQLSSHFSKNLLGFNALSTFALSALDDL